MCAYAPSWTRESKHRGQAARRRGRLDDRGRGAALVPGSRVAKERVWHQDRLLVRRRGALGASIAVPVGAERAALKRAEKASLSGEAAWGLDDAELEAALCIRARWRGQSAWSQTPRGTLARGLDRVCRSSSWATLARVETVMRLRRIPLRQRGGLVVERRV
jgi:hypothetical protein